MGCCSEHSRSELVRRGLAEAGRGLPAIEPGMPVPAGTGLDRRTFLARGAGLALAQAFDLFALQGRHAVPVPMALSARSLTW